ncbi:MAG: cytoskeleton protein RodZ [Nitrospinales bacterium]|jgi:cytoskeleton protein RodZ
MVENFGSYLKHERELRGVPLEEISGATKIHIRFLQALEDNKFDEIPGEVFIKGYIRSYANTIGSDVEEMLNIYEESVGNKTENSSDSVSPSNTSAKNFLSFALIGLIILALIFGVRFLIFNKNNPPVKNVELNEKQNAKLPAPLSIKALEEKTSLTVEVKSSKENDVHVPGQSQTLITKLDSFKQKPDIESQLNSLLPRKMESQTVLEKPLKLTIKVKNNSWFNMTIDDFREEDFILPAGEEKSYLGNNVFRLTIGNKQGTEIILNGKTLVIPESKENVVKDFIINSKLIE